MTDLEELLVEQAPDADNAFVMTTPEVLKIISYSGEVADCGEVSLLPSFDAHSTMHATRAEGLGPSRR